MTTICPKATIFASLSVTQKLTGIGQNVLCTWLSTVIHPNGDKELDLVTLTVTHDEVGHGLKYLTTLCHVFFSFDCLAIVSRCQSKCSKAEETIQLAATS